MDVCMRYFHSHNCDTDFFAIKSFTDSICYLLCKKMHTGQFVVFKIENIIHFTFGNN